MHQVVTYIGIVLETLRWSVGPLLQAHFGPSAASSCPSPLTPDNSHVLLPPEDAIAQGFAHHARTGLTRTSSLISSPPAHSTTCHWSPHACNFLVDRPLVEVPLRRALIYSEFIH
ncbi:hypothetical protein JTB14_005978 [Gonioctena quinquepunctata]|nr:hypothetical protein JTB14_005978 [Gonioctena quinquepunctata]